MDRELDAWIAKHLFGLQNLYDLSGNGNHLKFSEIPYYSVDIKDAWEVAEKLRTPQMGFSLATLWDQSKNTFQWIAKVEFTGTDKFEFVIDDAAPMAICQLAKKVHESQKRAKDDWTRVVREDAEEP